MERLHHPNIIRIFEVLETYSKIYMIVEFASGGELFHKIVNEGKFSEQLAKVYFAQIISAVFHMVRNIFYFCHFKNDLLLLKSKIVVQLENHNKFWEELMSSSAFLLMWWRNCSWRGITQLKRSNVTLIWNQTNIVKKIWNLTNHNFKGVNRCRGVHVSKMVSRLPRFLS